MKVYNHQDYTCYKVYVANDKYGDLDPIKDSDKYDGVDELIQKIVDSIPELKGLSGEKISFSFMPENTHTDTKNIVAKSINDMQDKNTNEDVLKSVVGVVAYHFTYNGWDENKGGMTESSDYSFTMQYDKNSLQKTLDNFKQRYGLDTKTAKGLDDYSNFIEYNFNELRYNIGHQRQVVTDSTGETFCGSHPYYTYYANSNTNTTSINLNESLKELKKKIEQDKYETILNIGTNSNQSNLKNVLQNLDNKNNEESKQKINFCA